MTSNGGNLISYPNMRINIIVGSGHNILRALIFEHPFETTLVTTYFLSLFIGQKQ